MIAAFHSCRLALQRFYKSESNVLLLKLEPKIIPFNSGFTINMDIAMVLCSVYFFQSRVSITHKVNE